MGGRSIQTNKQTVNTLINNLILVFTVCSCPIKGAPGKYRLTGAADGQTKCTIHMVILQRFK